MAGLTTGQLADLAGELPNRGRRRSCGFRMRRKIIGEITVVLSRVGRHRSIQDLGKLWPAILFSGYNEHEVIDYGVYYRREYWVFRQYGACTRVE